MGSVAFIVALRLFVAAEPGHASAEHGKEVFEHVWIEHDPYSAAGDGLGPRYNEASCASCHAAGGAGDNSHNTVVVSGSARHRYGGPPTMFRENFGRRLLSKGVPKGPPGWQESLGMLGTAVAPLVLERNTPALFGAGLIDAIADDVILAAAQQENDARPKITGRVGRTAAGRVARFGWKGDVDTLATFVAQACAMEVGLETPVSRQPGKRPPGVDLDEPMFSSLVAYVRALPQPQREAGEHDGKKVFEEVGCTGCHRQVLGEVDGIYSDLLLHDMGNTLADGSAYYGGGNVAEREWRTPPLWGVASSAPYLHDGRAKDLNAAISAHGGEASDVRDVWSRTVVEDKEALVAFLLTLRAPH